MRLLFLFTLLVALLPFPAAAVTWTVLDYPGADGTIANGINSSGTIVGTYYVRGIGHCFLWSNGKFTSLDDQIPAFIKGCQAINDNGDIVGWFTNHIEGGRTRGFLLQNQILTVLSPPTSTDTFAFGVNNARQVVGTYFDSRTTHGFKFEAGVFTTIDIVGADSTSLRGINNLGDIIGTVLTSDFHSHGVVLTMSRTRFIDESGALDTYAFALNDFQKIVGQVRTVSDYHGFAYSRGTFFDFINPGSSSLIPGAINNSQQIVGQLSSGHGFLRTP